jgi:hypothetical protein
MLLLLFFLILFLLESALGRAWDGISRDSLEDDTVVSTHLAHLSLELIVLCLLLFYRFQLVALNSNNEPSEWKLPYLITSSIAKILPNQWYLLKAVWDTDTIKGNEQTHRTQFNTTPMATSRNYSSSRRALLICLPADYLKATTEHLYDVI